MASLFGRKVVAYKVNKSGGGVIAGDVVVPDTSNDNAFTTTTSAAVVTGVWIADETIASNATGRVVISGHVTLVNVSASVTRGHTGTTHTVAKQAVSTGAATRTVGTFCKFTTGGTTPEADIWPVDLLGSSLTNPMTTAEDIIKGGASGVPARLAVGAAGSALSVVNSAIAWNSGTSNPGSAVTGDRYWRTDLGLEAYYDGTRWLTTTLYWLALAGDRDGFATAAFNGNPIDTTTSAGTLSRASLWHSDFALWLVNLYGETFTSATNNGSNYWIFTATGAITTTAYGTFNTSADTAATHTGHKVAINAVAGSTERAINLGYTKSGTPGNCYAAVAGISYRLIVA